MANTTEGTRAALARAGVAAAVWAVTTAVALAQLFLGGTVGLADNGDAARLMCRLGLVVAPGSAQDAFVGRYDPVAPCPPGGFYEYRTPWRPVVSATVEVWQAVTGSPGFDVAALAVVACVLLGAMVATLFLALPGRCRDRLLLSALVAVASCDIGFLVFANSGYGDTAGFLGFLGVCAGLVGLVTRRSVPWLLVTALALAFLSTAKTQLATAVVAAAVALLVSRRHWARGPADPARTDGTPVRRRVPRMGATVTVVLLAIAGLAGFVAGGQGEGYSRGNKFDVLFYTILADSPDPAADLRDMGLPVSLAQYAGRGGWDVDTPYGDPALVASEDRAYAWSTYVEFLATHPDRLVTMLQRSFDAALDTRVDYLANLPGVPGGGARLTDRPSPVLGLLEHAPHGWPVPFLLLLLCAGAGLGIWWARSLDPQRAARGVLLVTSATFAASQSVVALSDGYYELARHNVHAAFGTAVLLAVLLEIGLRALWSWYGRRRTGRAGTSREAPA